MKKRLLALLWMLSVTLGCLAPGALAAEGVSYGPDRQGYGFTIDRGSVELGKIPFEVEKELVVEEGFSLTITNTGSVPIRHSQTETLYLMGATGFSVIDEDYFIAPGQSVTVNYGYRIRETARPGRSTEYLFFDFHGGDPVIVTVSLELVDQNQETPPPEESDEPSVPTGDPSGWLDVKPTPTPVVTPVPTRPPATPKPVPTVTPGPSVPDGGGSGQPGGGGGAAGGGGGAVGGGGGAIGGGGGGAAGPAATPTPPVPPAPAVELPTSDWAKEAVNGAVAQGLVDSADVANKLSSVEGLASPITRREFCHLARLCYEKLKGPIEEERYSAVTFLDCDEVEVRKLAALDVVRGIGHDLFDPQGLLTREQAATMLSRLALALGKPFAAGIPTYADNGSISPWAIEAVGQMQLSGVMNGTGNNAFTPQGQYSWEQSVVTLWRLYELTKE